ncbi:MAG: hypothetical protein AB1426_02595 [Bacillota bacterium]
MEGLFSNEILKVWKECINVADTNPQVREEAAKIGAEIAALLGKLEASQAAGIAALIILAYGGALNYLGQARREAEQEGLKAALEECGSAGEDDLHLPANKAEEDKAFEKLFIKDMAPLWESFMYTAGIDPEVRKKAEETSERVAHLLEELEVVPLVGITALLSICYNVTSKLIEQAKQDMERGGAAPLQ